MADTMGYKQKYWIVFVCMFIQAILFGIAQNIQPLFIPYVIDKFNFSLASFSLIFTFGAVASAVFSPFLGNQLLITYETPNPEKNTHPI